MTPHRSARRSCGASARAGASPPDGPEHELLRARLAQGPCFFTDLLAELDAPAEALRVALWDLVWAGEVTNDAWAPLRAPASRPRPRRSLAAERARVRRLRGGSFGGAARARRRVAAAPLGVGQQVQGRWSLTEPVFRGASADPGRAQARARASCCSSATGSSPASRCSPRASGGALRRCMRRSPT